MIVVTGATGNVGTPLVGALAAAGAEVTAVSRSVEPGQFGPDVRTAQADVTDPESLRPIVDGAEALFLHDTGMSAHLMRPADILDVAKAGGVRRVVLLSSQGVVTRPDSVSHGGVARAFDAAVRQSGLDWTILRPGAFHSNAYAWSPMVRGARTVTAPYGDVGLPTVDPRDIAEVAAAALRTDEHAWQVYTLTGPELSTPRQRTEALASALGEPIRFVEQTRAQAREQMLEFMPEAVVETTLDILGAPTDEELRISTDVTSVLGRPARPFKDWAQAHIAAFR
ncbi:NAD(P)H-binding protein [Nocardia cyriacigeorgica]|uniref:NAD(P)H-binding protein n=1 Tax=Nocardia cyriacigeorgica TaxID=135487 RepID=A0A6P1CR33_9NOCA|nr:NAD(P)H-binding protein [Nocardia cyriacigeorgica]MBF6080687.1 NAD(P)H-binding protein [Nocardia cyriacigeorgica]MBF6423521.1 NAD(P)H-binding protein [Nocardia cyriacigeorgica]NEW34968.1 NAD(P)H-binding protein [Nocardia cyriacigeorgica]BDU07333.1 NmrA family transcriptional regulator [Nocardia cyriacigeorgica]